MKTTLFSALLFAFTLQTSYGQVFVSDSTQRFSNRENKIFERLVDSSYTIERSNKTISVTRVVKCPTCKYGKESETSWKINMDPNEFSLAFLENRAKKKGNTKTQTIKGTMAGFNQMVRVIWTLVDRNNDGKYESLEYAMREGDDIELYIFCHLK
jgi:hypothetical protein